MHLKLFLVYYFFHFLFTVHQLLLSLQCCQAFCRSLYRCFKLSYALANWHLATSVVCFGPILLQLQWHPQLPKKRLQKFSQPSGLLPSSSR